MQIARFHTSISRDKLKQSVITPDTYKWGKTNQIQETHESYYQPAVELLDAISKKQNNQ
ncbi:hypothetical protein [Paenibacillus sp. NEAU-GSW1]|uniref:hypothetical protein n=1 Tax=Paenibacillus sp. NEAU-GSW1 TaxID=2682486 RepID=UPI0012E2B872|nr:hypothetical protein [Paenibacillus sp. NEAU-GSW1]MUT64932.1 hypothetical protein [Paenibacillus sp. NEAU-GSW1]